MAPKPTIVSPQTDLFSPSAIVPQPRRVSFSFEADDELVVLVDRLRERLRHRHPEGRLQDIFKEASRSLLDQLEKVLRPSRPKAPMGKGHWKGRKVPAAIRRAVWTRDEGRCAYVSEDGRRCESRNALELDHVVPWAVGGRSDDPENIRLLCRPHNQRLARKRFGPRRR